MQKSSIVWFLVLDSRWRFTGVLMKNESLSNRSNPYHACHLPTLLATYSWKYSTIVWTVSSSIPDTNKPYAHNLQANIEIGMQQWLVRYEQKPVRCMPCSTRPTYRQVPGEHCRYWILPWDRILIEKVFIPITADPSHVTFLNTVTRRQDRLLYWWYQPPIHWVRLIWICIVSRRDPRTMPTDRITPLEECFNNSGVRYISRATHSLIKA